MKVVLVLPAQTKVDELSDWWYPPPEKRKARKVVISLGMLYLCSSIRSHHEPVFIDNSVHGLSDDQLADWCVRQEPDVVGFGGTSLEWPQASSVAGKVKSLSPKIVTVYGGPNATARPEKHVRYFDYVLRGMAEETFHEFLCCLDRKKPPHGIRGLCSARFPAIQPPHFCQDLDGLPWPDRAQVDINRYVRAAPLCPYPTDVVVASRGCPCVCRFCSSKYIWDQNYLTRSVQGVIDEILYMKQTYGSRAIHFREDNFTADRGRLLQFCTAVRHLNVDWLCQSRLASLDETTVQIMKESGCRLISCGFESINDSTLQYVRKGHTAAQVVQTINMFEKVGMAYTGAFMVATPNEGREEIANTLNFVKSVSQYDHSQIPDRPVRFVGIPVSELYHEIVREGLVEFDWQEGELLFPRTFQLSVKEVDALLDESGKASLSAYWRHTRARLKRRVAAARARGVGNMLRRWIRTR